MWWSGRIPEAREDLLAVLSRVKGLRVEERTLDYMTDYEAFWIRNYEDSPALEDVGPGASSGLVIGGASGAPPPIAPGGMGSPRRRVKLRWEERRLCVATSCDGMVRARAADVDARRAGRTRLALQAVRRGLDALAPVRGRKSLLLLSDGFLQDFGTGLREVAAASREANAAIYFVDVRGLLAQAGWGFAGDAGPPPDPRDQGAMALEETTLAAAGTEALADETGGFSVRNTNDLAAGIDRIADESRVFYMLGFYPPEGKAERRWRKLRVEVKRPGLTVRARRGYTLRVAAAEPPPDRRKQGEEAAPHRAVARALDSAQPATGIPLRAMAYVLEPRPQGKVHVVVAAELDASRLAAESRASSRIARLEVSVVALNRDTGRGFRHDDTLELELGTSDSPGWRSLYREFELLPGVTQARVVVRDAVGGAVGSVTQRFEVPAPGSLRLSTPILTDRVELPKDGQSRPQPVLAVHRTFASGGGLYCEFEVFGAARPPGGGAPNVSVGLALWTSSGRLVFDWEPTPIVADPDGRVVRLVGMNLEGAEEGLYDLVFDVRDEVSGARFERRESFRISQQVASR
jgi:VWFA-related protein